MFSESDMPAEQRIAGSSNTLWLGWESSQSVGFGFTNCTKRPAERMLIQHSSDSHLITFGPTGTGKGTGAVVPNLLKYAGSCVVLDLKNGELTKVTARRRREMGQKVIVIDPFEITGEPIGGLNPFSIFDLPRAQIEADSEMLAETCSRGLNGMREPFWDQNGTALLAGVIATVASLPREERTMNKVFDLLQSDDTVNTLGLLIAKNGSTIPKMARREITAVLQMPEVTRGGVIATAQSYLKCLHNAGVLKVLDRSDFPMADLVDGVPMTIYIVLPVDRLRSHRAIVRLLLGVILKAIVSRVSKPELRTLLLVDECAQLEHFPFLEAFITLCRSFGCWVWTFWQDLSQLQSNYPSSWKTILNNSGVIQTFGINNRDLAEQWTGYFDSPPELLRGLAHDEQMLLLPDRGDVKSTRLNYLTDRTFNGLYDDNPQYSRSSARQAVPPVKSLGPCRDASTKSARKPRNGRSDVCIGDEGIEAR